MIFIDLDEVLVDLHFGLYYAWMQDTHGFHRNYPYNLSYSGPEDPEFAEWINHKDLWTSGPILTPEFWHGLEPYPWTAALNAAFPKALILSNPGRRAFSFAASHGKILWCDANLHKGPKHVILAVHKHLLAAPGRVLIDDKDDNINKWREAGGVGILFPQPWNSACMHRSPDPLPYIREKLKEARYET